ncbi:MAG TPA: DUF3488 and transglutaminase-like domain-containing protein [Burkholderiaceae bacterium]|nr:DUF3488 and transglutaminase-like domain-containing protein [Burkholderiaceae bacterium]
MATTGPAIQTAPRRMWLGLRRAAGALVQPQMSTAARERRDMLVLLLAVAFVVAPHFEHLPWWAGALLVLLWVWRLWLTLAQQPLPGRFAMLPLLLAAAAAVWLQHGTLAGRDAGVTFLLLLMALKLLEMRARRDVFVVIFLCFFILLTQFLFNQGLGIALLTIAAVVALFFVLVSVNLVDYDLPAGRKLRLVGLVLAKALPLTVAMFVLFPRVSGPLWGLPTHGAGTRTGLSDSMSPGSISSLLESNEIAFRVQFDGATPRNERLYWRGPVFGAFNGRTWTELPDRHHLTPLQIRAEAASLIEYTVTLEPHKRDWLFALEMPALRPDAKIPARLTDDAQLLAREPVLERMRYPMRSFTAFTTGLNETRDTLREWLRLPPEFNPRTRRFAGDLRNRTPAPEQQINAVLAMFRNEGFTYTLEPATLGRHSVDDFLFETREGFCEHYASAFVVLMRMLDIPARVVTGYQGGEINPVDGFLTVRQSDAHAWAEAWLPGRGWVRVDPTAVVAPLRIDRGTRELARQQRITPLVINVNELSLLRSLRFNLEALQNAWNQWVLSYSPERQRALLEKLGLDPDWRTLAMVFVGALLTILTVLAAFSLRHRVERDPLAVLYGRFRKRLQQAGVHAPATDGPRALGQRLESELTAESFVRAGEILAAFEQWRYSRYSVSVPPRALRRLRRMVQRFHPRAA